MPSRKQRETSSDLVRVDWVDAHSRAQWMTQEEAAFFHANPPRCESIGRIFKKDQTGITLFGSVANDGDMGDVTFIPAGMIKKITVLKKAQR